MLAAILAAAAVAATPTTSPATTTKTAIATAAATPKPEDAPSARELVAARRICADFAVAKTELAACLTSMLRNSRERRTFGPAYGWAHLVIDDLGDWTPVGDAEAGKVQLAMSADGSPPWAPRAWLRTETQLPDDGKALSRLTLYEFDCVESRMKKLQMTAFPANDLKGPANTVTVEKPTWEFPTPASPEDQIKRGLCEDFQARTELAKGR